MADFVLTSTHDPVSFASLNIGGIWKGAQLISQDANTDDVLITGGAFSFEGTGFASPDAHGFATTGNITSIHIVADVGFAIDVTGLSISAAGFETVFKNNSTKGFINDLFGGDDTFTLAKQGSAVNGYAGDDVVHGSGSVDLMAGGAGSDTLYGGGKGDTLEGDAGADTLTGGGGSDTFLYNLTSDSHKGGIDTITDLENTDTIDLHGIDADKHLSSDQAFTLVTSFTHVAGQLTVTYDSAHSRTVIAGDTNGDGKADLIIYADGNHASFSNFDL